MIFKRLDYLLIGFIWLSVLSAALFLRPILPMDETRYFSVAWSMWREGNWLVPSLNGEIYSHKPPLLFWLIKFGWCLFGVVDWWPRVIAPCFGLGCIFLVFKLSRQIWPKDYLASHLSVLILLGTLFWMLFGTLTMFDTILAFFSLVALNGIVFARQGGGWKGFFLVGVALGFGLLAKGPAIFLHVLPVALSAPWWGAGLFSQSVVPENRNWYLGISCALILGLSIALTWAVPASINGGAEYRDAIFWGQSTGRLVDSFAHARPFWWYAVWLLPLLFPWVLWLRAWNGVIVTFRNIDGSVLFCLIWFFSAFIIFSAISGKQFHYLLPEFPAVALLMGRGLSKIGNINVGRGERLKLASIFIFLGLSILVVFTVLPLASVFQRLSDFLIFSKPVWAVAIVFIGVIVLIPHQLSIRRTVLLVTTASAVTVIAAHLIIEEVLRKQYDLMPLAREIRDLQNLGFAIANANKYHGQFDFLGRLSKPIWVVGQRNGDLSNFLSKNGKTRIVVYYAKVPAHAQPLSSYKFRKYTVAILDGKDVSFDPELINRN